MSVVFEKTKLLTDKQFHYCPGCNHGIIHRLVAEVIDEMNLDGKVIGVAPVGCSVFAYDYFNCDMYEASHGRAPAVATGAKRVVGKDTLVFTYQGDGDLASIGTAEIVHAAHRGEKISTIFVNNAIYGMVNKLDGINVNFNGDSPTLIVHNLDQPGHVAEVTSMLSHKSVNIATMQLYRNHRGGYAVMVIETDQDIPAEALRWLSRLEGVIKVTYLNAEQ